MPGANTTDYNAVFARYPAGRGALTGRPQKRHWGQILTLAPADEKHLRRALPHAGGDYWNIFNIMENGIETNNKLPVATVSPVAPWLGGKSRLAKTIVPIIDAHPHQLYAEPFIGMGGVFLRRTKQPRGEVINDLNREVINLFRILQRHYPQFIETIKFQITSRAEFERLKNTDPQTLTDLERAARFVYLQKLAFGGRTVSPTFGVHKTRPARFNLSNLEPLLEDVHARLSGVSLECLDWAEFVTRYDKSETLFYLDPPYWGNERDYGRDGFARGHFVTMRDRLAHLKGSFLLSINDRPEVRELFKGFEIKSVTTTYTVAGNSNAQKVGELLIANFDLP